MTPTFSVALFLLAVCMLAGWYFAGAFGAVCGAVASLVVTALVVYVLGRD